MRARASGDADRWGRSQSARVGQGTGRATEPQPGPMRSTATRLGTVKRRQLSYWAPDQTPACVNVMCCDFCNLIVRSTARGPEQFGRVASWPQCVELLLNADRTTEPRGSSCLLLREPTASWRLLVMGGNESHLMSQRHAGLSGEKQCAVRSSGAQSCYSVARRCIRRTTFSAVGGIRP